MELTEQIVLQVTLSICRLVMLAAMMYTIADAVWRDDQAFR
jgi:hypothetical protein